MASNLLLGNVALGPCIASLGFTHSQRKTGLNELTKRHMLTLREQVFSTNLVNVFCPDQAGFVD